MLTKHWAKISATGGAVITIIGLASFQTWRNRLGEAGWAIHDNPVATGLAVFGLLVIAVGQWEAIRSSLFGSKRWRTDKELGDELNTWLRQAGFALQDAPPGSKSEKATFQFSATMFERATAVAKMRGDPVVVLTCRIKPSPEHAVVIADMSPVQLEEMREDIAIELLRLALTFDATDPTGRGVTVIDRLFITDALTQWEFVERVTSMSRAVLLAQVLIGRHVRQAQINP